MELPSTFLNIPTYETSHVLKQNNALTCHDEFYLIPLIINYRNETKFLFKKVHAHFMCLMTDFY